MSDAAHRHRPPGPRWSDPLHLVAFGFGAGASPVAPGTLGTLVAVPLWLLLQPLDPGPYLAFLGLMFLLGLWICGRTARDLGVHDHPGIVWDEMVGLWLTLYLAPPGWQGVLGGVLLFRLFDILKPWPIGFIDRRVQGGLGIMLDDVLAGAMAWIVLHAGLVLLGPGP
ncbi:MAG: phosphatidylglycerophosphatase A [Chromatiales bacterium]|jgi:phosphatidylglycerophosphatase A